MAPKVIVEAGAGSVSKACAAAVARAGKTTRTYQAAVVTSVAQRALTLSGTSRSIIAQAMTIARAVVLGTRTRCRTSRSAEVCEAAALTVGYVALTVSRASCRECGARTGVLTCGAEEP